MLNLLFGCLFDGFRCKGHEGSAERKSRSTPERTSCGLTECESVNVQLNALSFRLAYSKGLSRFANCLNDFEWLRSVSVFFKKATFSLRKLMGSASMHSLKLGPASRLSLNDLPFVMCKEASNIARIFVVTQSSPITACCVMYLYSAVGGSEDS